MSTRRSRQELSEEGRARAREVWNENEEMILQNLLELTGAMKEGAYGCCPRCKTNIVLRIPDGLTRVNASKTLREMGFGKIAAETPQAGGLTVHRTVIAPDMSGNGDSAEPVVV